METTAELSMSDYWLNLKNKKNSQFYLVRLPLGLKAGEKRSTSARSNLAIESG